MNRENGDRTMMQVLASYKEKRPSVFLHVCCAPCASASVERIHPLCNLTLVFFNPNIMPFEEYDRRKKELIRFVKENPQYEDVEIVDLDYSNEDFIEKVVKGRESDPEKGPRCLLCYDYRMRRVALFAKDNGADLFATTLTISPHKSTDDINVVGRKIEKEVNMRYLPTDFKRKKGYERSLELSTEFKLYRQSYCGCKGVK